MTEANREAAAYHALAEYFGSSYARLTAARRAKKSWQAALAAENLGGHLTGSYPALTTNNIRLMLADDSAFPPLLRELPQPPHGIYVKGTLPIDKQTIAIVGTRKATVEGRTMAREFARTFARAGVTVVSGLAFGIDAAAHLGALEAHGRTVAVLACGVDTPYPVSHTNLARRITKESGALVSEYPPGSPPLPYRFLERNRLVAGLSLGVVVIEAPNASGSLVTARLAAEAGRSVFVLPGPARHPNFVGSHALIRDGAELATCPEEVLESLGLVPLKELRDAARAATTPEDGSAAEIIAVLRGSTSPVSIDTIIERTGLTVPEATRTLTTLILEDAVRETNAGYVLA